MKHINNLPAYASDYNYIVARICDNEFWFWGAYETFDRAQDVADEVNGIVVIRMEKE